MTLDMKIDLVKALMQIQNNMKINGVCTNCDLDGGIEFTGYRNGEQRKLVMDKYQVEIISECKTINEVIEAHNEMEYGC